MRGVSMLVLQEYRAKHGLPPPTLDDMRALTDEGANAIYEEKYAKHIHFDELPSGLDLMMLDIAIMEGVRGSLLLLQRALNLRSVTGIWDERTESAVAKSDARALIATLTVLHMQKKMHARSIATFGRGWSDRMVRRYNKALEMVG